MNKLIILQGPPGSGKTTYAKQKLEEAKGTMVRVNRDELRAMLTDGHYDPVKEETVKDIYYTVVGFSLQLGKTVISDNTNLKKKDIESLQKLAELHRVPVELVSHFVHTPLDVCIARMQRRKEETGQPVVRRERLDEMMEIYRQEFGE